MARTQYTNNTKSVYRQRWRYEHNRRKQIPHIPGVGEVDPCAEATIFEANIELRPNGNGSTQNWDGANSYLNIDDFMWAVPTPSGTGDGFDVYDSCGCGNISEWIVEDVPSITCGTAISGIVWCLTGNDDSTAANLKWNGVWQTEVPFSSARKVADWEGYHFSITDDLTAGVTGIEFRVEAGDSNGDMTMDAAYVQLLHTRSEDGGEPPTPTLSPAFLFFEF